MRHVVIKEQKRAVTKTDDIEHSLWYPHVQLNVQYQNENFWEDTISSAEFC